MGAERGPGPVLRVYAGVEVELTRKDMRSLRLRVLPGGRVLASAPRGLPEAEVEAFVRSRIPWIEAQRARLAESPRAERRWESGERLYLRGQAYPLRVETGRAYGLALSGGEARLTVPADSSPERREAFVNEWYRARLKADVQAALPGWERATGLCCRDWRIKNMRSRWGTCNTRARRIWLNLQLAKYPPRCLDYVIVHELAHLRVPDHGPAFRAILDAAMPDWRAVRAQLRG